MPRTGESTLWQSADYSLYLNPKDDNLDFNNRANLGKANDNYAGGLSFFSQCLRAIFPVGSIAEPTGEELFLHE